jgi:hypothetical protein
MTCRIALNIDSIVCSCMLTQKGTILKVIVVDFLNFLNRKSYRQNLVFFVPHHVCLIAIKLFRSPRLKLPNSLLHSALHNKVPGTWPFFRRSQSYEKHITRFFIVIKISITVTTTKTSLQVSRLKFYMHLCFYSSYCIHHQSRSPSLIKLIIFF